jgi:hypothetical protein
MIDHVRFNTAHEVTLALTSLAVVYHVSLSRGGAVIEKLVGPNYGGIIHSDRLRSYRGVEARHHQLCWAHLLRNHKGLGQRVGPAEQWATITLEWVNQLFKAWHQHQRGSLNWKELGRQMERDRIT